MPFYLLSFGGLQSSQEEKKSFQAMFTFINIPAIGFLDRCLYPDAIGVYIPATYWWIVCWFDRRCFLTTDTEDCKKQNLTPRLINPVTVMVIRLYCYIGNIHVPKPILNPSPLSARRPIRLYVISGALIASTDLKKIFSYKEIYLGIGIIKRFFHC